MSIERTACVVYRNAAGDVAPLRLRLSRLAFTFTRPDNGIVTCEYVTYEDSARA